MRRLKDMLTIALSAMLITASVYAFPTQAGSCAARGNALGGLHWYNMQVGGGPLSDHGLELRIDGKSLPPEGFKQISVGTSHSIELVATLPSKAFRGFLLRLESPDVDTIEALSVPANASNIQVSKLMCVNIEGVGGLTHTGSEEKTRVKGFLQVDKPAWELYLEVTVVVQNRGGISWWFYSEYTFEAVSLPPPNTSPPTREPTPPTPKPTKTPTPMPTNALTPRPTPKPSKRPTPAPSPFPTRQPTEHPSQHPSMVPSPVPSHQPTKHPTIKATAQPTPMSSPEPTTKTLIPTGRPSFLPTVHPSRSTSTTLSKQPSESPLEAPTTVPSPASLPTSSESPTKSSTTRPSTIDNALGKPSTTPSQFPSSDMPSSSNEPLILDEQDMSEAPSPASPSTVPSISTEGQSLSTSPTYIPSTRRPTGSINALAGGTSAASSLQGIVWTSCTIAAITFCGLC